MWKRVSVGERVWERERVTVGRRDSECGRERWEIVSVGVRWEIVSVGVRWDIVSVGVRWEIVSVGERESEFWRESECGRVSVWERV